GVIVEDRQPGSVVHWRFPYLVCVIRSLRVPGHPRYRADRAGRRCTRRDRRTRSSRSAAVASVSAERSRSDAAEPVDLVDVGGALLLVTDAEPLLGGEAQHADLALVQVLVDVVRRLPDVVEGEGLRQGRVDLALGDEAVGLPRL